jgi:hypothetical protein
VATLQSLATLPPRDWGSCRASRFWAGLGAGVLAAFALSLVVLPFLNAATRLDSARFG